MEGSAEERLVAAPSREAITFAFIASAFEEGKGALHGLTPLFGSCVARQAGRLYEPSTISQMLKDTFELDVSPLVVNSMVSALVDAGYLVVVESVDKHGAIYRCVAPEKSADANKIEQQIDDLFCQFRAFAEAELRKSKLEATTNMLDSVLLKSLVHPEVLEVTLSGLERAKPRQLTLKKATAASVTSVEEALRFLCADFIDQTMKSDSDLMGALVRASWGALVSQVVLELQRPDAPTDFRSVNVLIDAPIILDALDVGEQNSTEYAKELIGLLRHAGIVPKVFSHSIDEMRAILGTTINNIDLGYDVSGPIATRIRKRPHDLAHIRLVFSSLDARVESLGIIVQDNGSYESPALEAVFPQKLIDDLRVWISGDEIHLHVDRDLRDAMSVGYAVRLRGASPATSLSCSGAVFVSKNRNVISTTKRFIADKKLAPAFAVPIVLTDEQLAGIIWFSAGNPSDEVGQKLTQLKLAANCAKAIQPSPGLIESMRHFLADSDALSEFEALLRSDRSAVCLVRETIAPLSLQSADDAERILGAMKSAAIEEERARIQLEFDSASAEKDELHRQQIEHQENRLREAQEQSYQLQAAHLAESSKLKSRIEQLETGLRSMEERSSDEFARSQSALAILNKQADSKAVLTSKRVKAELFLFYLVLILLSSRGPSSTGLILSVMLAGIGFWFAPDLLFGKLAKAAAEKDRLKYLNRHSGVITRLSANQSLAKEGDPIFPSHK